MTERWNPIPGYPGYEASSEGRVRSVDRMVRGRHGKRFQPGIVLKQRQRASGHYRVNLSIDGVHKTVHVHQLVMRAFAGLPPEGMEVCHNDGDPTNNAVTNLRYDTASGNFQDRILHGVNPLARRSHCPKGHAFDSENTYRSPGEPTARRCRRCDAENKRRQAMRRKANLT